MLLEFLVDIVRDRQLMTDFESDPEKVYTTYSIGPEDLEALRNLRPGIRELLPAGVLTIIKALHGSKEPPELHWPGPVLKIEAMRPTLVARGVPVEIELTIGVNPADIYDERPYTVDMHFEHEGGERVAGALVLPIRLPANPVTRVSFRCRATFPRSGRYSGKLVITKFFDATSYPHTTQFELGLLIVQQDEHGDPPA